MTKDKRDVVINTKLAASGADVSQLDSTLDIVFDSDDGATIEFKDNAPSAADENSTHEFKILDDTGATIATFGAQYNVSTKAGAAYSVTQTMGRSTFDPPSPGSSPSLPRNPQESHVRTWAQPVSDASGPVGTHNGSLDARIAAANTQTHSVSQSVQSSTDNSLVLEYSVSEITGRARGRRGRGRRRSLDEVASGTVTFTISASVNAGYSLGTITVNDS